MTLENVMVPTWIKGDYNYETKAIELFQTLGLIDRVHHLPSHYQEEKGLELQQYEL